MQKVRFYREPKPALKIAELFIKKGIKKMKTTIKLDTKLLDQQITLCSTKANNASDELERDLFTGLENLLTELSCAIENDDDIEFEAIKLQGRMTIRELMKYEADVDVYNNITDDEAICLCCPLELTEEGLKEWGDVLDYIVETTTDGDYSYAICFCDDNPAVKWQTKKKRLTNFLWSAAGYCSDKDYNKWFME